MVYQKMTYEDACAVLEKGRYGVLATVGEGGKPYGVPLFYAADGHHVYFCSTGQGQKSRNLQRHAPVSLTVVEQADGRFYSVIAFGEVHPVTDPAEEQTALDALHCKYTAYVSSDTPTVWRMDVEYVSGRIHEQTT